ncbi:uncharacterized protein N7498_004133 [Penicillium cinerascens]|uniref:Uncharacterized protein n=1 Tax=Penicillium cinerascens TaxID=70096 RepID=A0A9W9N3G9_9EURO|nr:uncharacterized protein N7498_004133 [Penicillium cinerascens]KAJ5212487.1 hypothetical protein N7498_004133 [Penicillium cinerascens]
MAFWVGWALWEKLTLVLVLIAASLVLQLQQWRTRRYAAAEAHQKVEDSERYPMLAHDDIPFGARALERGVQIEGIWISNHNTPVQTPHQPGTPIESRSPSPAPKSIPSHSEMKLASPVYENIAITRASLPPFAPAPMHSNAGVLAGDSYTHESQRPRGMYSSMMASSFPIPPSTSHRRSDTLVTSDKRASFHSRVFRASQLSDTKGRASPNDHDEAGLGSAGNDVGARPGDEQQASRMTRLLRRRSSEEFRRKMSAIFNERIHMNTPSDQTQDPPTLQQKRRTFRKSLLGPFRS